MKIALIADVHGNFVALEAVMKQIQAQNVDQVICLGDVAATGAQPRECVQLLQEQEIPTVLGNADDWLLAPTPTPEANEFTRFVEEVDCWCSEQLKDEERSFLQNLPLTLETQLSDSERILSFHGSPRSYNESLVATTPDDRLAEILLSHPATIFAGGHTHQQLLRRWRDITLINPGSVGMSYERDRHSNQARNLARAEYALLQIREGTISVKMAHVPFDVVKMREAAIASGMPHVERWLAGWAS